MEKPINAITPLKIAVIAIILIIIIASIYIFFPKKENKQVETEPELIHLTFDNILKNHILFSNIKIFKEENTFYLTAKATNMTSNDLKISIINISLKDKNNKETTLTSYLGDNMNPEEEKSLIIKTDKDLSKTKDIVINVETRV